MIPMQLVFLFATVIVIFCLFQFKSLLKKQKNEKIRKKLKKRMVFTSIVAAGLAIVTVISYVAPYLHH
ncbi:hypothetical protein [Ethanoligenens sp.]|uniref:hypothetical protein n=1 Tax=Ethanoligenens sp. TaxID=2099655 RepID=UPI0039E75FCE